jgi:hypothetical protein
MLSEEKEEEGGARRRHLLFFRAVFLEDKIINAAFLPKHKRMALMLTIVPF